MFSVVTANVNGIRAAARRGGLDWLRAANADVWCLQEVRAGDEHLASVLNEHGLQSWSWVSAPAEAAGRAGVAIVSRDPITAVRVGLPGFDSHGRWLEADVQTSFGAVTVVSAYVFTGEALTPRQEEKFRFLDAMQARMVQLVAQSDAGHGEAVITGDLNIAHGPADLKNWKGNRGKAGFLPEEQAYFDGWFTTGWTDLGRHFAGEVDGPYTWWSWRGKAFDTDTGWRIDYLLATPGLTSRLVKVEVGRAPSYAQRWSDHAPVMAWFD